jgi:hypothetical protein
VSLLDDHRLTSLCLEQIIYYHADYAVSGGEISLVCSRKFVDLACYLGLVMKTVCPVFLAIDPDSCIEGYKLTHVTLL